MNILDKIKAKIALNNLENQALSGLLATIREGGFELETATLSVCGNTIDFDNPSRLDVEKLLIHLKGGKWDKQPGCAEAKVNYETREEFLPGFKVRLWSAPPPRTCRIVEEEIEVPAQPARKEIRKRLVCSEPLAA